MKPGPWWRAQNSCVDNAKLILLSDKAHRAWFNLVCVASAHGGVLPSLQMIAVKIRMTEARTAAALAELVSKGVFDKREDGSFVPHDWNDWQFKSDAADPTAAERQRRMRVKKGAEFRAMKEVLNNNRHALRNAVTSRVSSVSALLPETETEITSTVSVERGLGKGNQIPISSELSAILTRGRGNG